MPCVPYTVCTGTALRSHREEFKHIDGDEIFDFIFGLCLCPFGGLFGQNNTSQLLAAAHLVLFVTSQILTPDGGRIKSVWRSITSYNFGRAEDWRQCRRTETRQILRC